jgi:flagellar hook-length control protein FliK
MDGEGGFNATGLGDDGSKGSSNAASSSGSSTDSTAAGSKVSNVIQQTAASDIRSPGIQVAMQLSKAAQNGIDKLSIRLDPAELGRVDIKLEVGHDGRVIALVAAERPETLELLKSDARALERALQEAGLETDAGSLSFSLSQGDQQNGAMADNGADHGTGNGSGNGGNGDGEGANGDEAAEDSNVLPHVVSNRALDISV